MTRSGRQPCGEKEARIYEGSLRMERHMRGHWQGRMQCVWKAGKGQHVARMSSKRPSQRERNREDGGERDAGTLLCLW